MEEKLNTCRTSLVVPNSRIKCGLIVDLITQIMDNQSLQSTPQPLIRSHQLMFSPLAHLELNFSASKHPKSRLFYDRSLLLQSFNFCQPFLGIARIGWPGSCRSSLSVHLSFDPWPAETKIQPSTVVRFLQSTGVYQTFTKSKRELDGCPDPPLI